MALPLPHGEREGVRGLVDDHTLDALRAAAEDGDEAAGSALRHFDVIDAAAPGTGTLTRDGDQGLALLRRADEMNLGTGGDGDVITRVAGEGEGAVGQGEDQAAMADVVA